MTAAFCSDSRTLASFETSPRPASCRVATETPTAAKPRRKRQRWQVYEIRTPTKKLYEVFAPCDAEEDARACIAVEMFAKGREFKGIRRVFQYVEGFEYPQLREEAPYIREARLAAERDNGRAAREAEEAPRRAAMKAAEDAAHEQHMIDLRATLAQDRGRRLAWHRAQGRSESSFVNLPVPGLDF
jgi:hypothetical protein